MPPEKWTSASATGAMSKSMVAVQLPYNAVPRLWLSFLSAYFVKSMPVGLVSRIDTERQMLFCGKRRPVRSGRTFEGRQ